MDLLAHTIATVLEDHRSGRDLPVVLEDQGPLLEHGPRKDLALLLQGEQRVQVERHQPGQVQLAGVGDEIPGVEQPLALDGADEHELLTWRVAVDRQHLDSREDLHLALDHLEPAIGALESLEDVGAEAPPVPVRGVLGPAQVLGLDPVPGLRKDEPTVGVDHAPRVVEVQMREDEVGDVPGAHPAALEIHEKVPFGTAEAVEVGLMVRPEPAHPAVDEGDAIFPAQEQTVQRELDPVALIGGVNPFPEHLGHHAEHGAAIEEIASVRDDFAVVVPESHVRSSRRKGGSTFAGWSFLPEDSNPKPLRNASPFPPPWPRPMANLEWWQLGLLLLAGLVAGILNTLAGGGSLLTLPLMLWIGLPAPVANASNRVSLILQNVSGTTNFHRSGHLHWPTALILSACAIPSALVGARVALDVDEQWFRRILVVVLLVSIFVVARGRGEGGVLAEPRHRLRLCLWFVAVGFYAGFIQAGLGFALLALLHGVGQLDLVRANAVKVTIVLFCQIAALAVFTIGGTVNWVAGLVLAAGSATGAAIAVRMQVRRGAVWVRRVVLILLGFFAIILLLQEILAWSA